MKRVSTGIPGLDEMCEGGYPLPSTILVAGEPGTGKTTFAAQSLFHTANNGLRGMYVTGIGETFETIDQFLSQFKFYKKKFIKERKVVFLDIGETIKKQPYYILSILKKNIEEYMPNFVCLDPATVVEVAIGSDKLYREFLHDLTVYLKRRNVSMILTDEIQEGTIPLQLISYMVDGLIILSYAEEENVRRKYLEVLKMRGTNHLTGRHAMGISKEGLIVQPGLR